MQGISNRQKIIRRGESGALLLENALLLVLLALFSLSATAMLGKSLVDNYLQLNIALDVEQVHVSSGGQTGGLPPSFGGPNPAGGPVGAPPGISGL